MAGVRMTGLSSGLDTESLISQLSQAYQKKVDNVKKQQTKAEWKKEAWSNLNTKLMNFYKGALSTFKSTGTYNAKKAIGDLKGVRISAGTNAVSGSHKIQVTGTASAKMWTGNRINTGTYSATSYVGATEGSTTVSELYDDKGYSIKNALQSASFTVAKNDGAAVEINFDGYTINDNTTLDDIVGNINQQLTDKGVTGLTASFENGALKFTNTSGAETTDAEGNTTYNGDTFVVTASSQASASALGLAYNDTGSGTTVGFGSSATATDNVVIGSALAYTKQVTTGAEVTGSTKLTDLGISEGAIITVNNEDIRIDRTTTLSGLASAMAAKGINASYDANQGRFYISSKNTGIDNAFNIQASDPAVMRALGLDFNDPDVAEANKGRAIDATDASIVYNGVTYTQSTNTFNINGLTIEASAVGAEQDFSVDVDVDGIYDKIKNFVKEYNTLIKEMNDLYNAEKPKDMDPLTSEEKDKMTDEDIKNWEDKIKGSLLRRDDTISSLLSSMRSSLNKSVDVVNSDGTTSKYTLASFGVVTGDWSERGQLHINGDSEDSEFAGFADQLKAAIMANPDAVTQTFSKIGSEVYSKLMKAMGRTELSSSQKFYNDIQMDNDIKDYKDKVKKEQEKMNAEEDRYYKQFGAMEKAMAKLQSQQTYIAQLFGGN